MDTVDNIQLLDNDSVNFDDGVTLSANSKLWHPYVTCFHLLFRSMAIFWYLFCGIFITSFITNFVIITIMLSVDFWTVKNISGRLMVKLRWWNYITDEGKSVWVFESKKDSLDSRIHPKESKIFWMSLFVCQLFWLLMFVFAFFGFKFAWMLLIFIAITLNGANLYGYVQCSIGQKENITTATSNFFRTKFLGNALSLFVKKNASQTPPSSQTSI